MIRRLYYRFLQTRLDTIEKIHAFEQAISSRVQIFASQIILFIFCLYKLPLKIFYFCTNKISKATVLFGSAFKTGSLKLTYFLKNARTLVVYAIKDFLHKIYFLYRKTKEKADHNCQALWRSGLPLLARSMVVAIVILIIYGTSLSVFARGLPSYDVAAIMSGFNFFKSEEKAIQLADIETAAGMPDTAPIAIEPEPVSYRFAIEENNLSVEGVLVPQKTTVISSSRDGQIKTIYVDDGDMFKKGDVLIAYRCDDIEAELQAIQFETTLLEKQNMRSEKLFKLDIISDFERMDLQNEASKIKARKAVLTDRMEDCTIRAGYDGRVVNRLANDREYTRTDRVLMEVASLDNLQVEFLVPSKWLRWVNIGAPISLKLNETGRDYKAYISRIHGEIDPVSQSIQMSASLESYNDPLLPGMSGTVSIDIDCIRSAGIDGYLERPMP